MISSLHFEHDLFGKAVPTFPDRASDCDAIGQRIAKLIGRHELLVEGREIGRPFRLAEIHHDGAVLPDIVMVVGIVAGTMNEARRRALVEMDVVDAVAFAVEAAEDVDVAAFLMWTAEPKLEARKKLGLQVMIFLLVLSTMLYFTKRKVWANAH